jgi:hypothetical protein
MPEITNKLSLPEPVELTDAELDAVAAGVGVPEDVCRRLTTTVVEHLPTPARIAFDTHVCVE